MRRGLTSSPSRQPKRSDRRTWRGWLLPFLLLSLVLHGWLLIGYLLWPAPPKHTDEARAESPEMTFELAAPDTNVPPPVQAGAESVQEEAPPPPSPTSPTVAPSQPEPPPPEPPLPEPPMPEPPPLAPTAEPVPPPPELVQPPPEVAPQPPVPAPPVPQPVPVPAEPEPAPAPPPPAEPAAPPLLATPPPPLQPPPLQPLPKPLPPKPPAPRPPPRPTPKPAPAPSAPKFGDYFFIPPAPSSRQSRNGRTGGPIDLSLGPVDHYTQAPPRRNANDSTSDIQVTGAQVGSDWIDQLHRWWIENRHYPREAAENGEAGTVQIRVKVNRTGKVLEVELLSRSGSTWLDAASLATFRGRMLPPFPTNTPENEAMLTLTINYLLYHN